MAAVAEIRRDDEMPGRTENRESDERQQNRIKARDDGHGGDARITEHLRHVHR